MIVAFIMIMEIIPMRKSINKSIANNLPNCIRVNGKYILAYKLNKNITSALLFAKLLDFSERIVLIRDCDTCHLYIILKHLDYYNTIKTLVKNHFTPFIINYDKYINFRLKLIEIEKSYYSINKRKVISLSKSKNEIKFSSYAFETSRKGYRIHELPLNKHCSIDNCILLLQEFLSEYNLLQGEVEVGTDLNGNKIHVNLNKHCFITGCTGSGKTSLMYLLANQLIKKNIKILILPLGGDLKLIDSFKIVIPGVHFSVNPFKFSEKEIFEIIREASINTFSKEGDFTPIQYYEFMNLLNKKPRNLEEFIKYLDDRFQKETREDLKSALLAIKRRISLLNTVPFTVKAPSIITLIKRYNGLIVNYEVLKSSFEKNLLTLTLLYELFKYWNSEFGRLIVMIDECHRIASITSQGMNLLELLLREGRHKNMYFILSTQSPLILSNEIINNCQTFFIFRLIDSVAREKVARIIASYPKRKSEVENLIRSLEVKSCLLFNNTTGVIVKVHDFMAPQYDIGQLCMKNDVSYDKIEKLISSYGRNLIYKMIPLEENIRELLKLGIINNDLSLTRLGKVLFEIYDSDAYRLLSLREIIANLSLHERERFVKFLLNILKRYSRIDEYLKRVVKDKQMGTLDVLLMENLNMFSGTV